MHVVMVSKDMDGPSGLRPGGVNKSCLVWKIKFVSQLTQDVHYSYYV